ncbi:DNA adenine methylase [Candidatus Nitrosocosmicus franklandus]|uniref:site-specific DNA-methyltransferase (adenine-specific) n=1 Tax=Candidatus Nitrosocosmicus franklandianus TaxID=1798806 RepID=A0A484I7H2_9ARCH|nr:Dam family site-specific DNA-(adenine-N6)-methyltransferase [Candidatus Nitrosocosmicus franklandus]VFJ13688.1 Modification methylase MjaIII [Candidatus Nitrosocosmicus franklandus]
MQKTITGSFLKWAGGKKRLVVLLDKLTPSNIERYYEPFLGGGAFFFYLIQTRKPFKAFLSDSNPQLINTYRVVKNNVKELIEILQDHQEKYYQGGEKYYYMVRDNNNGSKANPTELAGRFIFLNKTCYNGLYRVNKIGNFNVPHGRYFNPKICNKEKLIECSLLLNRSDVDIQCDIYKNTTSMCKEDDFVYLDPPYFPLSRTSNFTDYTKESFGVKQHMELAIEFDRLNNIGAKVLLSNSNSEYVKSLYEKYTILKVKTQRNINCDAKRRRDHYDLIITNFAKNTNTKQTENTSVRKVTNKKKIIASNI